SNFVKSFTDVLDNDLNVSAAWASVFKWVTETNKRLAENTLSTSDAASALAAWGKVNSVLGLSEQRKNVLINFSMLPSSEDWIGNPEVAILVLERDKAKKAKDFKRSDQIRDELKSKGWVIEDSPKGIKLKKL
ncbi:MAG TPA: DALR domain-containing protein, partial [Verrucomicrobiae bacterium]|nr:DALR domain-containing protein [Verrucomicrobiae bacterium]